MSKLTPAQAIIHHAVTDMIKEEEFLGHMNIPDDEPSRFMLAKICAGTHQLNYRIIHRTCYPVLEPVEGSEGN